MTITGKENGNHKEIKGRAFAFQASNKISNTLSAFAFWQDYAKGRRGLFLRGQADVC